MKKNYILFIIIILGMRIALANEKCQIQDCNLSPVADFKYVKVGKSVSFDATDSKDEDGTLTEYMWDFGDGETGTNINEVHIYQQSGEYKVTLIVKDNSDLTGEISALINVGTQMQQFNIFTSVLEPRVSATDLLSDITWDQECSLKNV